MRTLADIEKAVPQFSVEELVALEQVVRKARREKEGARTHSLRDIEPTSVGKVLQPLGTREQWYDEMLEDRV